MGQLSLFQQEGRFRVANGVNSTEKANRRGSTMEDAKQNSENTAALRCGDAHCNKKNLPAASRRSFLGRIGASTALAAGIPLETVLEGMHTQANAAVAPYGSPNRSNASFQYRKD